MRLKQPETMDRLSRLSGREIHRVGPTTVRIHHSVLRRPHSDGRVG